MAECQCEFEPSNADQRTALQRVLIINGLMFVVEFVCGVFADSTGLVADSLDMFADASVYAISLYALGRGETIRRPAARVSGLLQAMLGVGVFVETCRRFIYGSEPLGLAMMAIGVIAFAANVYCLMLLAKHRHGDVNLRASWIFTTNDVIANASVILSGGLVLVTGSQIPDLVVGALVSAIVVRGGITILGEANKAQSEDDANGKSLD